MTKRKQQKFVYTMFLLVILIFSAITGVISLTTPINSLNAMTVTGYSNVLKDLTQDENFNEKDYPVNEEDYSLKLIQVAESTGGQLFVYVYQPSGEAWDLRATSINISQGINDNLSYVNYSLKLLSHEGVFYKYSVKDLKLKPDALRYYDIASIYRTWNKSIDAKPDNDNTINEVVYAVNQLWTATTLHDEVTYTCTETETITIPDKFVGFVRYEGGSSIPDWLFSGTKENVDRHFVAFNTDRPIDKLIEADLSYQTQNVLKSEITHGSKIYKYTYGNIKDEYSYLSIEDNKVNVDVGNKTHMGANTGKHFTYSWNSIQTISQFINSVNVNNMYSQGIFDVEIQNKITDDAMQTLRGYKWVLNFDATDYIYNTGVGLYGIETYDYSIVSNVTILRLKFEYDGAVYNLGVIDNKQTGSQNPINEYFKELNLKKWVKIALIVIVCIVAIIIIAPLLPYIIKGLIAIISGVFKAIWWLGSCIVEVFR